MLEFLGKIRFDSNCKFFKLYHALKEAKFEDHLTSQISLLPKISTVQDMLLILKITIFLKRIKT